MYDGFSLSDSLEKGKVEVVVEQYERGAFVRLYSALVPAHRLSKEAKNNLLKSLICRFNGKTGLGFEHIVQSYLNSRGKTPPSHDPFQFHVAYPEPGVLRTYCGTDTLAWIDEVVSPTTFRQ